MFTAVWQKEQEQMCISGVHYMNLQSEEFCFKPRHGHVHKTDIPLAFQQKHQSFLQSVNRECGHPCLVSSPIILITYK